MSLGERLVRVMAVAMALAFNSLGLANASPVNHVVEIRSFKFVPETVTANPGDTITWINRDIAPHTASSNDGNWDTGVLVQNASKTLVVEQQWASDYICQFHPAMKGKVVLAD
ncbi:MAG: hypothetical protein DHS20C11_20270 [Lysobacteraceae bacterium]|nr:MAG: hypothetical protein DHS20C11_20270 [Xanthomonadaceae bacterium]